MQSFAESSFLASGSSLVGDGVEGVGATSLNPAARGELSVPHHETGEHELSDARVLRCGRDEMHARDVDAAILLFWLRRAASYAMDPRRAVDILPQPQIFRSILGL